MNAPWLQGMLQCELGDHEVNGSLADTGSHRQQLIVIARLLCRGDPYRDTPHTPKKTAKKQKRRLAVKENCSRPGSHCPAHRSGCNNMLWAKGPVRAAPDVLAPHTLVLSSNQSWENGEQLLPPPNPETGLPQNPAKPPGAAPSPFFLNVSPATHPQSGPFQWNVDTQLHLLFL